MAFGDLLLAPVEIGFSWIDYASLTLLLLAHTIGGLIAGVLSPSSPGFNGALTAVFSASVRFVRFIVLSFSVLTPLPVDRENAALLIANAIFFSTFFLFTVLAGYLGGRLGGRLQNRRLHQTAA